MSEEQEEFEKDKQGILKSLPDNIKDMFHVIGFSRVERDDDDAAAGADTSNAPDDFVPCLILSPFDVPPRPVRDVYWNSLYMTAKKKKTLHELEYLAYAYGADDPEDCYLFIAHNDFISYEDGCAAGYDVLPPSIQAKLDAGQTIAELTTDEAIRVRGLMEMREDVTKPLCDRARGNYTFQERHEVSAAKEAAAAAALANTSNNNNTKKQAAAANKEAPGSQPESKKRKTTKN
jgi:hypothetical protein